MDIVQKLALSAEASVHEATGEKPFTDRSTPSKRRVIGYPSSQLRNRCGYPKDVRYVEVNNHRVPIHMAVVPGGRRLPLLKAMLTTACERDCHYCGFRAGGDCRRITFKSDEMAQTFFDVHQAGLVDGLFLSSGVIAGGANAQNKLLDTVEILRNKLGYRGYLHLKIMPGVERDQVLRAMRFSDRVSVNLEAPNPERLAHLAPSKHFQDELLEPIQWVEVFRRNMSSDQSWNGRWPSTTTQFVVGASGESDIEILSTVSHLHLTTGLSRAYFEAFTPVPGTPLENHPPEEPIREHRLYQASYLLRDYGFDLEELPFTSTGHLPLERDPKLAYAEIKLAERPLEINRADRTQLLRVPGIGLRGAESILQHRRQNHLKELSELKKIGVLAERAAPYITLNGKRPPQQMSLL
jgi:predicted DNA-binding helix-hairpin-helix protein